MKPGLAFLLGSRWPGGLHHPQLFPMLMSPRQGSSRSWRVRAGTAGPGVGPVLGGGQMAPQRSRLTAHHPPAAHQLGGQTMSERTPRGERGARKWLQV